MRTRAAWLSVKVKAIWETRGRLLLRAISAFSVSARRESWIACSTTALGLPPPAGAGPAPLMMGGPLERGAVGAPPPLPEPPLPLSSEPPDLLPLASVGG
jgi:hypothetical protein